jgi:uncharacterized protein YqjF (DUF2071 family)
MQTEVRAPPDASPVMYQSWRDLLFLHWEWDPDEIQRTLPAGLRVDRHEGRCYLGVVPFKMRRVRPRFVPPVPGVSDFLELNLRTYVCDEDDTPGVWFYSLDANQRLAVAVARRFFHLPYHWARMQVDTDDDDVMTYSSARGGDSSVCDRYRYRAIGSDRRAQPDSLEFFLLERYVLFAETNRGLRTGRVHHEPYPFRDVELIDWDEGLFSLDGFEPPRRAPDHFVISPGVDVSVYALEAA